MKTFIQCLLIVGILSLPVTRALSQWATQVPVTSVSGSAEVKVAPDEVYMKVGVETRNSDLRRRGAFDRANQCISVRERVVFD